MSSLVNNNAVVYCEGAFNTPNGKTAHGLVRFTRRYQILAVIDSIYNGQDAGKVLDGTKNGIPIERNLEDALKLAQKQNEKLTHFVIGLAPDGGKLDNHTRGEVKNAITMSLNIDSGLHDFLSEDEEMVELAEKHQIQIRDIRKPPDRKNLHFFSGKIEEVKGLKVAVLGTDSAVGKRTTAWFLVHALQRAGYKSEMIGTGQTAWMQGVQYGIILDSLVNDFISGEIEHAVWKAWQETKSDVLVIEGQGSLMNPAYPGGFEIIAAGRPDVIILQHAPARLEYDGFPGYPIHPLPKQIAALELISGKPVIAVTVNHENMKKDEIHIFAGAMQKTLGLPAFDPMADRGDSLADLVVSYAIGLKHNI